MDFNFAVSPYEIGSTLGKGYSEPFGPIDKVTIYEGRTIIINNFLKYTIGLDPFL